MITGEADSPHGPVTEEGEPGGTGLEELCHSCPKMKGYHGTMGYLDGVSRIVSLISFNIYMFTN